MELRIYLRALLQKWWIVVPVFLITLTATIVFTFTRVPTYESTATFIVKPNASFGDLKSFASGLDMLSRRTEIATTYAQVATSRLIRKEAVEELGLSESQRQSLSVEGQLLAGTNVIEITASGSDPLLVKDFADTVSARTVAYVQDLYETYDLEPLDSATLPISPVKPNKRLNLALGSVMGLALGVGLAFLSEYLQNPLERVTNFGILDNETGVYNRSYLVQRLRQEMSRSKRNQYSLSLALINVDQLEAMSGSSFAHSRGEVLRKVALLLKQQTREEDVLARFDGTTFALLFPDMQGESAKSVVEKLQARIAWTPFEVEKSGLKLNLSSAAGLVGYNCNGTVCDDFLSLADQALQQAEAAGHGQVCLLEEGAGRC
jgi:diguanylate cyclase (GGDEF)-like protein